jgi:hypothetical protein
MHSKPVERIEQHETSDDVKFLHAGALVSAHPIDKLFGFLGSAAWAGEEIGRDLA